MNQREGFGRDKRSGSINSKMGRVGTVAGVAILIMTAVSAVIYFWPDEPVLDRSLVADVDFSVYTPRKLPEGYRVDEPRTSIDEGMLTYAFVTKESQNITVTVQPIPENFDMSQIVGGGSITTTLLQSGTLYNLSAGKGIKYLLHTGDSLVFITSKDNIDASTVSALASSMTKIQ